MSVLHDAILESKKLKEEAMELAKKTLLESHKAEFDKLATNLFKKKLNEEDESKKEDDSLVSTDTRVKHDEIEHYLDQELGDLKDVKKTSDNIELDIELDDTGKKNIDKEIDLTGEENSDEIQKMFSSITDNDEIIVVKSKKQPIKVVNVNNTTNKKINEMMNKQSDMENIYEELENLEEEMEEDYKMDENTLLEIDDDDEFEIDGLEELPSDRKKERIAAKTAKRDYSKYNPSTPDDYDPYKDKSDDDDDLQEQMLENLSDEQLNELADKLAESLYEEDSDPNNPQSDEGKGYSGLDEYDDVVLEIEEPTMEEEYMDEEEMCEECMEEELEKAYDTLEEIDMEEGTSVGVSLANAKKQGTNPYHSYEKANHSRDYVKQLHNIQETFKAVSKEAQKIQEENKKLKKQLSTLNESENKLKELNSEYSSQLTKYKEKCYEALLEAKKAMCVNKILLENSTTKEEKQTIIEAFTNATTSKEIDVINKYLLESLTKGVGVKTLNESNNLENLVNKTSVLKSGSGQLVESTTHVNPKLAQMLKNIQYMEKK